MVERSLKNIAKKITDNKKVVIVGCGYAGKELYKYLKLMGKNISCFFDNNQGLKEKTYDGKEIFKPYKLEEDSLYIITIADSLIRKEILKQLLGLGISESQIEIYYMSRDNDFWSQLDSKYYGEELKQVYLEGFGWDLDIENPKTYNEKVCVDKVYDINQKKIQLTDKYLVKDWVKEKIGKKYVTKLYGVWDNAEEIDFEVLPNSFVLKTNHASGCNIVVKDKNTIDREKICKQLNDWLKIKYGFNFLELHYNYIEPKIICEEYLEGVADNIYDYNIYCFQGEPKYIWCIKGSHKPECKASFYDTEWNKLPFSYGYPEDEELAPKPKQLAEMLELSKILCEGFKHVRVDWYNMPDGRVLFGEMTFTTWGGTMKFVPDEYDKIWGDLI
ncbi:MAG: hypothetical protein IKY94_03325 [Lachnospiraceae bacterium]|nr:hypothetical protein [Lachnospiraceae bacterium]